MIFVSCFVWFYGEQLFFLLGNSTRVEILEMTRCLKILFIAVFFHAYFACLGTLLSATGGEFYINRMLIFSILINVVLNIFLLPIMGIVGAAVATAVSTLFISVSYLIYIVKNRSVSIDFSIYIKLCILTVGTVSAFYVCSIYDVQWLLATVVSGIVLLGMCFILNFHKAIHKL
jgi:Na+-driven multidrug efflux pump